MSAHVTYDNKKSVSTIVMDDGKVNAMSVSLIGEVAAALAQAEQDRAVVVLTGRSGVFSAGFDLSVFKEGPEPTAEMIRAGAALNLRLLTFPFPVVAACSGHAIAMGSFLLLCSDLRIGAEGPFKIGMNEVAIGMALPDFAVEIARQRMTPAHFHRATSLAELYPPHDAVAPGFLDRVVSPAALPEAAAEAAQALTALDMKAHLETKLRVRGAMLEALAAASGGEL